MGFPCLSGCYTLVLGWLPVTHGDLAEVDFHRYTGEFPGSPDDEDFGPRGGMHPTRSRSSLRRPHPLARVLIAGAGRRSRSGVQGSPTDRGLSGTRTGETIPGFRVRLSRPSGFCPQRRLPLLHHFHSRITGHQAGARGSTLFNAAPAGLPRLRPGGP